MARPKNVNWKGGISKQKGSCQDCGKPIKRQSTRCLSCARKGPLNPRWNNFSSTGQNQGRRRAIRRFPLGACVKCGEPSHDRHHINGNTLDNRPENILTLCRRCHMAADGRLAIMVERNKAGRKYKDNAEKFRALRARRTAEGRPIKKKKKNRGTPQEGQ